MAYIIFLLERDPALPIMEKVVKAAACNPYGKGALKFLLEKDPTLCSPGGKRSSRVDTRRQNLD
jgi:hypothetical protein